MKKIATIATIAIIILCLTSCGKANTATESTTTVETEVIELDTQSILVVDISGSMDELENDYLSQYNIESFDSVVYFDELVKMQPIYEGKNTFICETFDKLAKAGFEHITIVTDGEQCSPEGYASLGVYTGIDLTIHLVKEAEASSEFIEQLKSRLVNSNLTVVKPDGENKVILDDYQDPVYLIEIEHPGIASEDDVHIHKGGCGHIWLCILSFILGLLGLLLGLLSLLRKRGKKEPTETEEPEIPEAAVRFMAEGAHVMADVSSSVAVYRKAITKAAKDANKSANKIVCFGDRVSEHTIKELESIPADGHTAGWEACEYARSKGWDNLVIVSDLGFNVKAFERDAFSKKFKKIIVVTPSNYHKPTLENLKTIADEVEVLCL